MKLGKDENFSTNQSKELRKMKIDLNGPDVSEIIVKRSKDNMFLNNETGKTSDNVYDVIREDHRFIIIEPYQDGYYMYNDKEHHLLCVVFVKLDSRIVDSESSWKYFWVETDRIFISRDGDLLANKRNFAGFMDAIDICGQAVLDMEEKETHKNRYYYNYNVGSKQTAFEFFGGIMCYYMPGFKIKSRHLLHFNDSRSIMNSLKVFRDFIGNNFALAGGILNIDYPIAQNDEKDDTNVFLDNHLDIPKEAFTAMKRFTMGNLLNYLRLADDRGIKIRNCEENCYELSIIQKYKGYAIQRFFQASVIAKYPIEESEVIYMETTRKWFHTHMKEKGQHAQDAFLIWCEDDLTGTLLEYTKSVIDDLVSIKDAEMDRFDKNPNPKKYFWDIVDSYDALFKEKYGVSSADIIKFLTAMDQSSVIERFVNKVYSMMINEKDLVARDKLKECMRHTIKRICDFSEASEYLHENKIIFGPVDDSQRDLHKVLKIPKSLLNWLIREDKIEYIREFKLAFTHHKEDYEYFLSMNKKACYELADYVFRDNTAGGELPVYTINTLTRKRFDTLENLFIRNGAKNVSKYIAFLKKIEPTEYFFYFLDYSKLLALDTISKHKFFKDADWKLTGESLVKTLDSFQKINCLFMAENEINHMQGIDELKKRFGELSDKWEKYCYEDSMYQVSYPKGPLDLVVEGIALNHCAKNFIDVVSQGKSTVLFLRNKDNPDKPFYTVEVTNARIRQCHGFNNCIVEEESAIEVFLKKFCNEKGITWERGVEALGPQKQ